MADNSRIRQQDIADKLGLSVSQVSRALNGKGDVAPETRKKIQKLAQRWDYTPDIIAKSLRLKQTKSIGIIQFDVCNPFFSTIIKGVDDVAQKHSYSIIVSNTYEDSARQEQIIKNMISRGVDGLLVSPSDPYNVCKSVLMQCNIPVVFFGNCPTDCEAHCIVGDDLLGGYLATKFLLDRGYKKIIYIGAGKDMIYSEKRAEGFKKAITERGLSFYDGMVHRVGTTMEVGYLYMKNLLKRKVDIDGIFASNDVLSYGCLRALHESGMRVPGDIGIIGYDEAAANEIINPRLTCLEQPKYEIAVAAAELLLKLIETDEEIEPKTQLFTPTLIIRDSA
ncbi:MAG: LacI family DNA-binding transcriptional regulator [Spirochaetes bacterium]|nr:LacI family DNA-binding transcriptional regulator [Spirochaetota bacterium]